MKIEVEIRTITDTWITHVNDQEFADRESGAAAGSVRDRIKAGEPIEVRAEISGGQPHASRLHMVVFNPGHIVAVVEKERRRVVITGRRGCTGSGEYAGCSSSAIPFLRNSRPD